jgi:hypothetical protein
VGPESGRRWQSIPQDARDRCGLGLEAEALEDASVLSASPLGVTFAKFAHLSLESHRPRLRHRPLPLEWSSMSMLEKSANERNTTLARDTR